MDHESEDAHHGSTALVELLGANVGPLLLGLVLREVWDTKVAGCRALHLLPHLEVPPANAENELKKAKGRDGGEGRKTGRVVGELVAGNVDGTREADSQRGRNVAHHGKHGNTTVLQLHKAEAFKAALVGILEQAQRIEKAKRGLRTNLGLKPHLQGRRAAHAGGRGERRRAANKGSNHSLEHLCLTEGRREDRQFDRAIPNAKTQGQASMGVFSTKWMIFGVLTYLTKAKMIPGKSEDESPNYKEIL